jgi:hypothetical protein
MSSKKTKKGEKKGEKKVGSEEFVKVWQGCKDAAEVRAKLGRFASNRAATYRKHGVPLKKFTPMGRRNDYKALAKIAAGK